MSKKTLFKSILLALGLIGLQSCDKDFNTIGNSVIGEPDFDIESYKVSDLVAYNQGFGNHTPSAVESTNFNEVFLGAYRDPVFGNTTTSLVAKIGYPSTFPTIGENPKVDSVYIYIPYYSETESSEENTTSFKLKQVYGDASFKLEVYRNGYFISNPQAGDIEEPVKFYSDEAERIDALKGNELLNDSNNPKQNEHFVFDKSEIIIYKRDENGDPILEGDDEKKEAVKERLNPGMWLDLNKEYFQSLIFDNLEYFQSQDAFLNYFRGLYFKSSSDGSSGVLGKLDFSKAKMVVRYSEDAEDSDKPRVHKTIEFTIHNTQSITFIENEFNTNYLHALEESSPTEGDEKLYIKGGQGSMAIIDLFTGDNFKELQQLKEQKLLINEAILTVYVDQDALSSSDAEPDRLYLYNVDENKPIADYTLDASSSSNNPFSYKVLYGGILERESKENNNKGIRYRFKVTEHIRNLLKKEDNYSPKLGLVAVGDYFNDTDVLQSKRLRNEIDNKPEPIKAIPSFSIYNPLGTVVHGSQSNEESKRMKLEIFYTKTLN